MFRLDNILEHWATIYRPLSHDPSAHSKHRTFFRISMIDANSYFVRNFNSTPSPCMAYATHVDAGLAAQNPKALTYRHVIYFMVKQAAGNLSKTAVTDEMSATEARFQTDDMVQDLLAYLFMLKGVAGGKTPPEAAANSSLFTILSSLSKETREGLRGLNLDGANWGTLPMMFNGWHICGLTIEQTAPRLMCLTPAKYITDDTPSSSSD